MLKDNEAGEGMQGRKSDKAESQSSWGANRAEEEAEHSLEQTPLKLGMACSRRSEISDDEFSQKQNKTRALQSIHNCDCHTIDPEPGQVY